MDNTTIALIAIVTIQLITFCYLGLIHLQHDKLKKEFKSFVIDNTFNLESLLDKLKILDNNYLKFRADIIKHEEEQLRSHLASLASDVLNDHNIKRLAKKVRKLAKEPEEDE